MFSNFTPYSCLLYFSLFWGSYFPGPFFFLNLVLPLQWKSMWMGDGGEIPFYLFPYSYISNVVPFSTLEHFFISSLKLKPLHPSLNTLMIQIRKDQYYCTFLVLKMHLTLRKVLSLKPSQATSILPLSKDLL